MLTHSTIPAAPRRRIGESLLVLAMLGTMGAIIAPQLAPAGEDPLAGLARAEIAAMRSSIERYRSRSPERAYPDLTSEGWQPLIDLGILSREPANPITGRTCVADYPTAGAGWHYDRQTGMIGACYFNEHTGEITPRTP